MDNQLLKQLQSVEFQMLKDVDNYCNKNKIKYSLYAGSMLGAVRHGGFIPWDDDIDIAMTREEYTKFCDSLKTNPLEGYLFTNFENDENAMECHGKIRKRGTLLLQKGEIESVGHHEIWIDVFPLDKIPLKNKYSSKTSRIGRELVLLTRANGNRSTDSMIKMLSRSIIRAIPGRKKRMIDDVRRLNQLNESIKDDYEWASMSTLDNINKIRFPKEMLEKYSVLSFNGEEFMSFADYDGMLRIIYGDYMKLPPPSKRLCTHSPEKIRF